MDKVVHKQRRLARGVRMDADLWEFLDDLAKITTDGNASKLLERLVRERRDQIRGGAE